MLKYTILAYAWQDMRKCGCTLSEILQAGQWKSAAFMTYIDDGALEKVATPAFQASGAACAPNYFHQDLALAVAIESDEEEFID